MKICIAGSRCVTDPGAIEIGISHLERTLIDFDRKMITGVISGTARGADRSGEAWARSNGIPVYRHPADWDRFGISAGHRRNLEMANISDAVICWWDGNSRGTANMIECAKAQWKLMRVFDTRGRSLF